MTKDKERDDALIAEKERLADILEKKAGNAYYAITSVDLRQAAAILRGDEQPKPDRAEALKCEIFNRHFTPDSDIIAMINRHFDELRAEWEAERQDEPVCFIGKVDCDGNELVTVSKDALDRYKDQARYTYQRAEKAEARVKELEAERPAVVVPSEIAEALARLVSVIKMAGVGNLSKGVQLGQISWSVKCNDAIEWAEKVLSKIDGAKGDE